MRQPSLRVEVERRMQLGYGVVEPPVHRAAQAQETTGRRAQRIERDRLLQEFDRLVVTAEDACEARTRAEYVHVAGSEFEGALEFDLGGPPVPIVALEDHAETDMPFGEIRGEGQRPLGRFSCAFESRGKRRPAVPRLQVVRARQARPREREFGIERDRPFQEFCGVGDIRFGRPLKEITPLQVKAMGLRIVGAARHRGLHLRLCFRACLRTGVRP